jgi:hypothetical protein
MIIPPIAVCVKPTIFEKVLLAFITVHFLRRRIIPAAKSNIPMARNISVNTDMVAWSAKTPTSIMFSNIRKIVPVKIRLVTIRKPPMATLSLTIFRIMFTQLVARGARLADSIVGSQFNTFASFRRRQCLEPNLEVK